MSRPVIVLPSVCADRAEDCLRSIEGPWRRNTLVIDNRPLEQSLESMLDVAGVGAIVGHGRNIGVAASWNLGIKWAKERKASHLVLLSESITFKNMSFLERVSEMDGRPLLSMYDWHLVAIPVNYFDLVGPFDEGFYPAYFEDTDWQHRADKMGLWPDWEVDLATASTVRNHGYAQSITAGVVTVDFGYLLDYYVAKWGGRPGEEQW